MSEWTPGETGLTSDQRRELHDGLVRLCQAYGVCTDRTYDLLSAVPFTFDPRDDEV